MPFLSIAGEGAGAVAASPIVPVPVAAPVPAAVPAADPPELVPEVESIVSVVVVVVDESIELPVEFDVVPEASVPGVVVLEPVLPVAEPVPVPREVSSVLPAAGPLPPPVQAVAVNANAPTIIRRSRFEVIAGSLRVSSVI